MEIRLPGIPETKGKDDSMEKVELTNEHGLWFKESAWIGEWIGFVYTTVEHGGKHLTGYKLDQATEPASQWRGSKPHKFFGLRNGVLGYHYDLGQTFFGSKCRWCSERFGMGLQQAQKAATQSQTVAKVGAAEQRTSTIQTSPGRTSPGLTSPGRTPPASLAVLRPANLAITQMKNQPSPACPGGRRTICWIESKTTPAAWRSCTLRCEPS